ncbi:hypothetical protein LMED105_14480 [Limnobacter sp. MED105]|nr:hypothetical protein LMED105_14480 [Limnobacter sp. MED105]
MPLNSDVRCPKQVNRRNRRGFMTSKLRIKMGPIEVEYEGSEDFLKQELPELLQALTTLYKDSGISDAQPASAPGAKANATPGPQGTTNTYAAALGGGTGTELALAAGARLRIGMGAETFTRAKLLEEMKSASSYYKKSYSGNLSNIIGTLVTNQKFIEAAKDTYSLHATTENELRTRLAS